MSRDFVSRRRQTRYRVSALKRLLGLIAAFLCGYLIANIFDFHSLSTWFNKQFSSDAAREARIRDTNQQLTAKPKFEFYTLLSKDNSAPASSDSPNKGTTVLPDQDISQAVKEEESERASKQSPQEHSQHQQDKIPNTVEPLKSHLSTQNTQTSVAIKKNAAYLIQVAAFNKRADAERLKVSLVLIGYQAVISTTLRQNTIWHRVTIGPFPSQPEALKAQTRVMREEHMKGIIRRVG